MTNIEFAKEVAEKVWGWKLKKMGDDLYWEKDSRNTILMYEDHLLAVVHSWTGFGRSFDFIASKYEQVVTIDFCRHEDADGGWACNVGIYENYQWSGYGETQTKALHNVALQMAVKEEG